MEKVARSLIFDPNAGTQEWYMFLKHRQLIPERQETRTIAYHQYMALQMSGDTELANLLKQNCPQQIKFVLPKLPDLPKISLNDVNFQELRADMPGFAIDVFEYVVTHTMLQMMRADKDSNPAEILKLNTQLNQLHDYIASTHLKYFQLCKAELLSYYMAKHDLTKKDLLISAEVVQAVEQVARLFDDPSLWNAVEQVLQPSEITDVRREE